MAKLFTYISLLISGLFTLAWLALAILAIDSYVIQGVEATCHLLSYIILTYILWWVCVNGGLSLYLIGRFRRGMQFGLETALAALGVGVAGVLMLLPLLPAGLMVVGSICGTI
jgi:hypothetical protein